MSPQFLIRGGLAAAVVVAIPICLMLPGARPRLPPPHVPQATLSPFGTMPGQPIPTSLTPMDQAALPRPDDVRTNKTSLEIEYREPVTGGDYGVARDRIYTQAQKDCDAAAREFHKTCSVTRVAFDENPRGSSADRPMLLGHAELRLTGSAS